VVTGNWRPELVFASLSNCKHDSRKEGRWAERAEESDWGRNLFSAMPHILLPLLAGVNSDL
jgi:hypothetical protein